MLGIRLFLKKKFNSSVSLTLEYNICLNVFKTSLQSEHNIESIL